MCRFAPTTSGPAHPGTLLAALLCWLDARSRGARIFLRLEDLDLDRCRPEWSRAMQRDLAWLGLDFDAVEIQSAHSGRHEEALDRLAGQGLLYPCECSRSSIRACGTRSPDGGWRYPNRCRERELPSAELGGWRSSPHALRARLASGALEPFDEGGTSLAQDPGLALGDPVVRRRGGSMAYQLASVVDDAACGVTRVVRGRDLAWSSATQLALQRLLGLPNVAYRHHLLLLESRGGKLAKLHGAVGAMELRRAYDGRELCGFLAALVGLSASSDPVTPAELLPRFSWSAVSAGDRALHWTGSALEILDGNTNSSTECSGGTPTRSGKP